MHVTAAYTPALGPAALISYGPLEVADPGPTDVVIAVHAVALNPVDTFVRSGRFPTPVPLPLILGRDVVGTIDAAPEDSGVTAGQWVWANSLGYDGRQGSFADAVIAPADRVYPLPEGVDPKAAVSLAHPGSTAALGLTRVHFAPGETVLIGGGGGNVGAAAVTLAARGGARVVATASPADTARVRRAGADVVVDHHEAGAGQQLREALGGGAAVCWDTSGHMDYALLADLVAVGGQILITAAAPEPAAVPWDRLYTRDVRLEGFVHSRAGEKELAAAARVVNRLLAEGALAENITQVLPLSRAAGAHEQMEAGQVRGRIVLQP